jgi:hypothetical protein
MSSFSYIAPAGDCKQEFLDHAVAAFPNWFASNGRTLENLNAFAEIFCHAADQVGYWQAMSFLLKANGFWLDQHARDRGTRRQENESDEALAARLRTFEDAVTAPALEDVVQAILDAEGIIGDAAIMELRRDKAYFVTLISQTGTGGTFSDLAGDLVRFEPTAGMLALLKNGKTDEFRVILSGAATAGNDGTFTITGLFGDAVEYDNASGFAEADAGVSWEIARYDAFGNKLDGFQDSFVSRGDRMSETKSSFIVILPFGCTEATRLAVIEALRQRKGAGTVVYVECRTSP